MILSDPTHTEWNALDYKLAKAYELRQTYGDIPPWIDRSERVNWDVKTFTSRSSAAIERKQDKEKKKVPGRRYYAVPRVNDGGPMPTMKEYYEELNRLNSERI